MKSFLTLICSICMLLLWPEFSFCQRKTIASTPVLSSKTDDITHKIKTPSSDQIDLLQLSTNKSTEHKSIMEEAEYYELSVHNYLKFIVEKPEYFTQTLTVKDKKYTLILEKAEILAPGFHIKTSDGAVYYPDLNGIVHYRGYISGKKDSWVTLTMTSEDISYLLAFDHGNYEINKIRDGRYAGYFSKDRKQKLQYDSHTEDQVKAHAIPHTGIGSRTGNCLEVYLECDFYTYQQIGNVTNVDRWARTIFSNVAAVFALHQVPVYLSQLYIWTSADPYTSMTNLTALRNQFVSTLQNNYTGRVGQLLSLRPMGGGISNGIGGYCNSYPTYPGPQCISTGLSASNAFFPDYSFNTYVVSHELGHVMGLRHTHACVWNNTFVQIDDCGNVFASGNNQTTEGISCFHPASPIIPVSGGTIMSNCHLLPAVGINLNTGFGTLPGQQLFQNFVYAPCLTGSACGSTRPVSDTCINAITLLVGKTCKNNTFTNTNASSESGVPIFTCGNPGPDVKDVWFKIAVPPSGSVTIETSQSTGGLTDVIIQAYAGSCGALTNIACDDNSGTGNHALLTLNGRSPGEIIYIRLVDTESNQEGTFNICAYDASVTCHPDYQTLVTFYNAMNGPSWINKSGWQNGAAGTNCDVCSWYGITCNELGRVSAISLSSNNVSGNTLPSSLTNISYLQTFRLYNNNLSGTIPTFFSNFNYLNTLDLGKNNFTGQIPSSIGNITTLKNLYLDQNALSGAIPATLTNIDLSLIYLNNNNLSGCFPVGFMEFCSKSYNFANNPNLAGGISFQTYCSTGNGGDEDSDGFCQSLGDCNDNDAAMFPGNPEVCDLKDNDCNNLIDDLAVPQTNTWIGGSGNWHVPANWSLGMVPQRCQNVIISGTNTITVTIQSGQVAEARSVTVQAGKSMNIQNNAALTINYGLNLINAGTLVNNGTLTIHNILDNALFGIQNTGSITNASGGNISVINSGARSVSNSIGGLISNNGSLIIDRHVSNGISTGLYNGGTVTNTGQINVRNIQGQEIIILPGAVFTNQSSGVLSLE